MAFPTLSRRPIDVTKNVVPNLVAYKSEGGYEHRRPRYSRKVHEFSIVYDLLPTADRNLLVNFYATVEMHTSFDWTDLEGNTFTVYFASPLKYKNAIPGWHAFETIELVEL